jgi:hypothetical protein
VVGVTALADPAPASVGAGVLDETYATLRRFVAFPQEASRVAVTLWVAHTHAFEHANATPYLNVHSPAPRCGKSTLFELLAMLVRDAVGGSNMSPAVLYRLIDRQRPTLLIDEMDAQMRADREKAAAVQSILNSGYKRGPTAVVWRCEAPTFKPVGFQVFCPKAFAGVGSANLHATTLDRSIPVLLERKLPDDPIQRFRPSRFEPEADALRDRLSTWTVEVGDILDAAEPELPDDLDDRTQEIWEPLLAIADAAGGRWPVDARQAALALHTETDLEDLPLSIQLLTDTRTVFDAAESWTLSSEELCAYLTAIPEAPWQNWTTHNVKTGITPRALARFLRPFGIRSRTVRLGGETDKPTRKGYQRDWFEKAWERYAPDPTDDDQP